ncbi:MAG: hypothetical protein K2J44_02675 [Ruminococcus sp.]|nr:hypothetical protein [Ruminococcus sp.]
MKIKKILAPLIAVSMVAGAMPISNVSASNDPRIYVDIHYEDDGDIRADVMFDNLPELTAGGFHIKIGDGWKLKYRRTGKPDCTTHGCYSDGLASITAVEVQNYGLFVCFSTDTGDGYDFNGSFCSIYLEKTDNFSPDNAAINIECINGPNTQDCLVVHNKQNIITYALETTPTMHGAYEYKVGDVNSDGYVDAVDCSMVWSATKNGAYYVDDIKNTYKSIFPKAKCAAAPDANQDGWINYTDGDAILQYYADMSSENVNSTNIGKIDIFELFDD